MFLIETFGKIKNAIEESKERARQNHMEAQREQRLMARMSRQDMRIARETVNQMSKDFELQQFCWGPGADRNPAAQLRIAQEFEKAGALRSALHQYERAAKLGSAEAKDWIAENADRVRKEYLM